MEQKKEHSTLIKDYLMKLGITQIWLAKESNISFHNTNFYAYNHK